MKEIEELLDIISHVNTPVCELHDARQAILSRFSDLQEKVKELEKKNQKYKDTLFDNAAKHLRILEENASLKKQAEAYKNLRNAISDFNGHGMPGFKDRAVAYLLLAEVDQLTQEEGNE